MKNIQGIKYLIVACALVFVAGCGNRSAKLSDTKTIDNITYRIDYLPDYAKNGMETDSVELADLDYYRFTISEEKVSGKIRNLFQQSNYNKFLYYVNKNIENDFKSKKGAMELSPVQVFFESNNRLANKIIFLLAFEKGKRNEETVIMFNDNIFNNGLINFKYNASI